MTSPDNRATKHIDVAYKYVRELVDAGMLLVKWLPGTENCADLLTKRLGKPSFLRWRRALGIELIKVIPARGSVDLVDKGTRG